MTTKPKRHIFLITFFGKAGSGKDTAANALAEELREENDDLILRMAFADPIKEIAMEHFHWNGKKDAKGRRLLQVLGTEAGRDYNENIWITAAKLHIGQVAQSAGLTPDDPRDYYVLISDGRFRNEFDFARDPFGFLHRYSHIHPIPVLIRRKRTWRQWIKSLFSRTARHSSERNTPKPREFPVVIDNVFKTADEFQAHVKERLLPMLKVLKETT